MINIEVPLTNVDNLNNTLTSRARTANRDITKEIIEDWVGNAGPVARQIAFMAAALIALNSGRYTADKMVADILQLGHLDN